MKHISLPCFLFFDEFCSKLMRQMQTESYRKLAYLALLNKITSGTLIGE